MRSCRSDAVNYPTAKRSVRYTLLGKWTSGSESFYGHFRSRTKCHDI